MLHLDKKPKSSKRVTAYIRSGGVSSVQVEENEVCIMKFRAGAGHRDHHQIKTLAVVREYIDVVSQVSQIAE